MVLLEADQKMWLCYFHYLYMHAIIFYYFQHLNVITFRTILNQKKKDEREAMKQSFDLDQNQYIPQASFYCILNL